MMLGKNRPGIGERSLGANGGFKFVFDPWRRRDADADGLDAVIDPFCFAVEGGFKIRCRPVPAAAGRCRGSGGGNRSVFLRRRTSVSPDRVTSRTRADRA